MAGKFALLIGASSFGEGGPPALAAPEGDVVALQAVHSDEKIAGFRPGDVKFALNSGLEDTQKLVHWLFDKRSKDDLLLLYYTGRPHVPLIGGLPARCQFAGGTGKAITGGQELRWTV